MEEKIVVKYEPKIKLKKPKMFKVLIHNDDYTTMEFVIVLLIEIFNKSEEEAVKIMYDVHKNGLGVAGVYSYDIACTKKMQADGMSEENGFPLKFSVEEE